MPCLSRNGAHSSESTFGPPRCRSMEIDGRCYSAAAAPVTVLRYEEVERNDAVMPRSRPLSVNFAANCATVASNAAHLPRQPQVSTLAFDALCVTPAQSFLNKIA